MILLLPLCCCRRCCYYSAAASFCCCCCYWCWCCCPAATLLPLPQLLLLLPLLLLPLLLLLLLCCCLLCSASSARFFFIRLNYEIIFTACLVGSVLESSVRCHSFKNRTPGAGTRMEFLSFFVHLSLYFSSFFAGPLQNQRRKKINSTPDTACACSNNQMTTATQNNTAVNTAGM